MSVLSLYYYRITTVLLLYYYSTVPALRLPSTQALQSPQNPPKHSKVIKATQTPS